MKKMMYWLFCCFCTPVITSYAGAIQPFGAPGNFIFQTITANPEVTECGLTSGATFALIIMACRVNTLDCTDDGSSKQAIANTGAGIILQANATYHLSSGTIKALSDRYQTSTGSYPTNIQIRQLYCGSNTVLSNDGMYTASCSSSGCTATSGSITVTFGV